MALAVKSPPPKKGPKQVAGLIDAGVWLQLAGDTKGARQVFKQALELDPSNTRAKQLYQSTDSVAPVAHVRGKAPTDATVRVPPSQAIAAQTLSKPPASKSQAKLDELLREVAALRAQGETDRASGVVLRALMVDGSSLEAHEAAYQLMAELGRTDVAAVELVHFVKLCMQRGQIERARAYLPALAQLRADPKTASLAQQLSGDADDTLPPTRAT